MHHINYRINANISIVVISEDIKVIDDADPNGGTARITLFPIKPKNKQVNLR